jgi:hypothetical protein
VNSDLVSPARFKHMPPPRRAAFVFNHPAKDDDDD